MLGLIHHRGHFIVLGEERSQILQSLLLDDELLLGQCLEHELQKCHLVLLLHELEESLEDPNSG